MTFRPIGGKRRPPPLRRERFSGKITVMRAVKNILRGVIIGALFYEARAVLRKYRPVVIAVTGSVGKTSTKDAIAEVLKDRSEVRKSEKSYNSEIGVPLTVLGLPNAWRSPRRWVKNLLAGFRMMRESVPYPKVLVLEVGADKPGDIERFGTLTKTDIAVVTCLPDRPVHVENFPSPEAVREEKWKIADALAEGGTLVVNHDDAYIKKYLAGKTHNVVSYGWEDGATVRGESMKIRYALLGGREMPQGMTFDVLWNGEKFPAYANGVLGVQACTSALGAFAVGVVRGERMVPMTESILRMEWARGRMKILEGKLATTIIDDSYNSSPIATEVALRTLESVLGSRKIAMLGDMLELGEFSDDEHWRIGRIAGGFLDELITVGKRARWLAEGAKSAGLPEGRIHSFLDSHEAGKWMEGNLRGGDIILVKGSQGSGENLIRMERAVKCIMQYPGKAGELLVRQEDEWLRDYPETPKK